MFASGYVGSSKDIEKQKKLEKQSAASRQAFQDAKDGVQHGQHVPSGEVTKFNTSASIEQADAAFRNETVGLVTKEQFIAKRDTIADRLAAREAERKAQEADDKKRAQERRRKEREKRLAQQKLSFLDEEDAEDVDAPPAARPPSGAPPLKRSRVAKDPTIDTKFLPDKAREEEERRLREELRERWRREQEARKAERLDVVYSYWDGTGHRRKVQVRKGDTIGRFLKLVQEQLSQEFRAMKTAHSSDMLYVKEDYIMPHDVTFHDLIENKVQGRSGPLFAFNASNEGARAADVAAAAAQQESHAGKVVERHWYDKNKHIFPASRWTLFEKDRHLPHLVRE
ncbi:unnamed protein product [Pedinophyceae sp. YPF-701]|nr:unnamed protein product [Pedinophyceae sp. YPF-701]